MSGRHDFDLIVIGSGAGGGVAADYAAGRGKRVLLIERDTMGGECPNFGCVPTKALLQAAETYETVMGASQFGINVKGVSVNYKQVQAWKDLVVARTGTTEGEEAFRSAGVHVLRAEAKFISSNEVMADGQVNRGKRFLVATGSSNFVPPIPGLAGSGFISFKEAIDLDAPPKSIFIIGGGPIGCEFAQIFSTFGSQVTIADAAPRLLGREDHDASELLAAVFESRGINVATGAEIRSVENHGRKKTVHYKHGGRYHNVVVDEVLVATGKRPNTDLGLEFAKVKYDRYGIKVNSYMQTTAKHIFAAGDVVGPYLFTHTGSYQGHIAAHNAFARLKVRARYDNVPRCTYTRPEVASVGISEAEALEKGMKIRTGAVPISIVGRANTSGEGTGFAKVITDQDYRVIGGVVVGARAGEMIHELSIAIQLRATSHDVANSIHAFPTFSEVVKFAAAAAR